MKRKHFRVVCLTLVALIVGASSVAGQQGAIHTDLATAIAESELDMSKVLHFDPIEYRDGVATYKMWEHGSKNAVYALVAMAIDPTRPDLEEEAPDADLPAPSLKQADTAPAKILSHPSSGRCTIFLYRNVNFNGGTIPTNLDWNAYPKFANQTNFNDHVTSLRTGCDPILIYPHKNFGGGGLFFPANASIPDLSVYNFNDKASSHFIYCQ